jgi:DNA-binding beta-propeller fold protein YncE
MIVPVPAGRGDTLVRTALLALLVAGCAKPPLSDNGVVGMFGSAGLAPGELSYPRAIGVSADNHVFVADKSGRIQRFAADGTFELSWYMPEWKAGKPLGLTVHPDGRLFVADTHYSRVLVFDDQGHELSRFGEHGEGPGQFLLVTDVAVDDQGYIYISEYGGNDRISKFSPELGFVRVLADQPVAGLRLSRPAALAIDGERTLWVADACNHRILRLSLDGELLACFGHMGQGPGELRWPYDISVCADGSLLVSEFGNNRLQWLSPHGESLRLWGEGGRHPGQLNSPFGVCQAPNGLVYVLDAMNNRVQIIRM